MKNIYYIVNLSSGKSAIGSKLGNVIDIFTKNGFETTVYSTQEKGDAIGVAESACNSGNYDYIVCSGGDGTLSEVIEGVLSSGKDIPIGYIPSGSTNDFGKGIGIPMNIEKAAENFTKRKTIRCDIGRCNNKTFTYIAAFGAFTDISYETPQKIKNILGHVAYILNGMVKVGKIANASARMRVDYIDADGEEISIKGEFIYGMVTNSSSVGGFLSLNDFLYDDGTFEVTLIRKPSNIVELSRIVASLNNISMESERHSFVSFRASKVRFTVLDDKKVPWTLDGEYGGSEKVHEIVNLKQAVKFVVADPPKEKFTDKSLIEENNS